MDTPATFQRPPVTAEERRLDEARAGTAAWRRWGPYLSERQWGTMREDYSAGRTALDHLPHDHARSRAYRWGEDGIAGICDDRQRLCFALTLWNGADPILKERMFGLGTHEGNHGEDVKEYYFYLDNVPSHAYMKYSLQVSAAGAFPYTALAEESRRRSRRDPEYELLDTGIFDEDRYFDVFVEYAKLAPDDILIRISARQSRPRRLRRCTCCRRCGSRTTGRGSRGNRSRRSRSSDPAAAGVVVKHTAPRPGVVLSVRRGRGRATVHR